MSFEPSFTVTHVITADLTRIERARGFLEAATLSEDWIRRTIRRDALVRQHALSERQAAALGQIIEHGRLTIHDYEKLCPGANRRTLQRDLRVLVEKGLLVDAGTGPTDPTRHYRLTEGLVRSRPEL